MINNYKYLELFLLSIAIIISFRELFSYLIQKTGSFFPFFLIHPVILHPKSCFQPDQNN